MRVDANNVFHRDVAPFIDVFLDGEKVERAYIADTEFGEVYVYDENMATEIKKGVVTLCGQNQFAQAWLLVNGY